ncbi:response regulator [Lentzea nigeriaca]|uniref:response regulator n=1 Tax=Lentzea nigeriaca TaxID=1128665 RepID=UPI00195B2CD8|nr:response regulator transcription factor [Lentzea nigeriaca]MBM7858591.1 DNA-binding NarL/FixJ family response regulator [Lentzea nigeriaca]
MGLIRVLLVDDLPLVRIGLRSVLCERAGMAVVGEAEDGADAVELCRKLKPDVVLMDIRMPRMDGLEALSHITGPGGCTGVKVVMFTIYDHDEYLFTALCRGATGFIVKDSPPEVVVAALRAAHSGEALLSPSSTLRLISAFVSQPPPGQTPEMPDGLTGREFEVLQLVVSGLRNEEIADRLMVSYTTVKSHVRHLHEKLGCRDRVQLVIYGFEHGIRRW